MDILQTIKDVNERNKISGGRKREELTVSLLKKILNGIVDDKPVSYISSELSISKDLIRDVMQDFEIDHGGSARRVLRQIEDDVIEKLPKPAWLNKTKDEQRKIIPIEKPKQQITARPEYNRAAIEKRLNVAVEQIESQVPPEQERSFILDIDFGFRRIVSKYGEDSDFNLTVEQLKKEVIVRRPDLKDDKEFFDVKKIEG